MDSSKKSSQTAPLMIAIGPKDKENLASPGLLKKCKRNSNKSSFVKANRSKGTNNSVEMIKNQINNFTTGRKVTAEDLTTSRNPGDAYWEQLAESRRVALEATMKENMDLHKKVHEMEYEVTLLKSMLADARQSIQALLVIANDEIEESGEENETDQTANDNDDSIEDASFTSI